MLTSCPSCGRAQVDLPALALQVSDALKDVDKPIKVAVMGCAVNGPGEAADADIAVVGGKGVGMLYIKGKPARRVPEGEVIAVLMEEVAAWEPSAEPTSLHTSTNRLPVFGAHASLTLPPGVRSVAQ